MKYLVAILSLLISASIFAQIVGPGDKNKEEKAQLVTLAGETVQVAGYVEVQGPVEVTGSINAKVQEPLEVFGTVEVQEPLDTMPVTPILGPDDYCVNTNYGERSVSSTAPLNDLSYDFLCDYIHSVDLWINFPEGTQGRMSVYVRDIANPIEQMKLGMLTIGPYSGEGNYKVTFPYPVDVSSYTNPNIYVIFYRVGVSQDNLFWNVQTIGTNILP